MSSETWTTKEGVTIPIRAMADSHLRNCIPFAKAKALECARNAAECEERYFLSSFDREEFGRESPAEYYADRAMAFFEKWRQLVAEWNRRFPDQTISVHDPQIERERLRLT